MEIAGQDAELPEIRRRAQIFGVFVALALIAIAARLFYLQVVEGDAFYKLTSDSIIKTVPLPAVRGEIRDHKKRVLATIRPSYDVHVVPKHITADAFTRLRNALALSPEEAADHWERIENERKSERDRSIVLCEDVPHEAMAAIETGLDNRGVSVVAVPRRHFPYGSLASHVLGFMNEVSPEDLAARKDEGYRAGDLIGRTGVERQWEAYLRGRSGFEKIVVARRGLEKLDVSAADFVDGPVKRPSVPGSSIVLTLDVDVQRIAERALRGHRAAGAVVLEVETGRLLAMVSKPGFDPNTMSGHLSAEAQAKILADRFRPLRDKTLNETYNPGSTFKVVSAMAALEDRLVSPEDKTKCKGFVEIGRRRFKEINLKAHGAVALYGAIVQSCNVFFYELGGRPGMLDRLARYAAEAGLGAPSGLGLNGEEGGFLATEEWYNEQKRRDPKAEGFMVGHALNAVIGEGATRSTVLQMATLYAAIANGGKLWLPQIVERIESPQGTVLEEFPPRLRRDLSASPETLAFIREALVGVVNDPKGTAWSAHIREVEVAGKTGTAQVQRARVKPGEPPPPPWEQNAHAWFVGFAPAGRPRIAFAILIEHGGHGGDIAAPVAMEIARNYFNDIAPAERDAPRLSKRLRPGSVPSTSVETEIDAGGEANE